MQARSGYERGDAGRWCGRSGRVPRLARLIGPWRCDEREAHASLVYDEHGCVSIDIEYVNGFVPGRQDTPRTLNLERDVCILIKNRSMAYMYW